jgi:release factor glutamine methyltransferase
MLVNATVAQALAQARASGLDALDAQLLLARCLGRARSWLMAHADAPLDAAQGRSFAAMVARRAEGQPLAYLVGEKEFHGLSLEVTSAVLVPRPETEHLVDWGLEILARRRAQPQPPEVLDLGTGSGAIALAIKSAAQRARVCAVDVSADALSVARGNARRLGLEVEFLLSNWWAGTHGRAFDLVLCNPPYIAKSDRHLAALAHEPALALSPGASGLEALRAVIEGAATHMRAGAWLLLEHGSGQAGQVVDLLRHEGFARVQTRKDLAGLARCSGGCWGGTPESDSAGP